MTEALALWNSGSGMGRLKMERFACETIRHLLQQLFQCPAGMTYWHQLLSHIIVTPCGRRLSTLPDVAEFAAANRERHRWKYAGECARLAALSKDTGAIKEATIAAQNAVFLDELTGAQSPAQTTTAA